MKVKIFALVAAFFMLMGGSAWAQADVKGDVNKDGVVNEQDIAAILAIMAKNNGVAEKTKYYWYVGNVEPTIENYTSFNQVSSLEELPNPYTTTSILKPMYILSPSNVSVKATTAADKGITLSNITSSIEGYSIYKSAMTSAGTKIYFLK